MMINVGSTEVVRSDDEFGKPLRTKRKTPSNSRVIKGVQAVCLTAIVHVQLHAAVGMNATLRDRNNCTNVSLTV